MNMKKRTEDDIRRELIEVIMILHHANKGNCDSEYADVILTIYDLCCELEEYEK